MIYRFPLKRPLLDARKRSNYPAELVAAIVAERELLRGRGSLVVLNVKERVKLGFSKDFSLSHRPAMLVTGRERL
jgi:hypothetical protein